MKSSKIITFSEKKPVEKTVNSYKIIEEFHKHIGSMTCVLCFLVYASIDDFCNYLNLSNEDSKLLKSSEKAVINNDLFSDDFLFRIYFFVDGLLNNTNNYPFVLDHAKYLKEACKNEIIKRLGKK